MKTKYIFLACIFFSACKKDNNSSPNSFQVNLATESSPTQLLSGIGSCQISTGSGSWAGDRVWGITLSSGKNIVNIAFVANFTDDKITLDSTLSFSHRKGDISSSFFVNYEPDGGDNRPGTDSSFFHINISFYDGHSISGSFSFENYDPGVFAKGANGQFANVPVTVK